MTDPVDAVLAHQRATERAERTEWIDVTPSWRAVLPIIEAGMTGRGSDKARATALEELRRMAGIADLAVQYSGRILAATRVLEEAYDSALEDAQHPYDTSPMLVIQAVADALGVAIGPSVTEPLA